MCSDKCTSHLKSFLQEPSISSPSPGRFPSKKPPVHGRNAVIGSRSSTWKWAKERAKEKGFKREMEMKNLKLYMVNKMIVDENEKLRRKAMALLHENKILFSQLQKNPKAQSNSIADDNPS